MCSKHDVKIIKFRPVIGRFSGHQQTNENGLRLIDFATSKNMTIRSTFFQHLEITKRQGRHKSTSRTSTRTTTWWWQSCANVCPKSTRFGNHNLELGVSRQISYITPMKCVSSTRNSANPGEDPTLTVREVKKVIKKLKNCK